ncbi:MAG: histidinol phosphate phosphatase domain-containing protein [Nitrospirae bacterium]|uniref:histidinol phosphate phosphatase domain-containing protein n=1 Tax=Candidatus Magnetobacterium casense TaxID=1455061 RepID=UPI00059141FD|nr:histidinol phosphate phosphatase domain-containing protein [Candidatus Magnetobacterium casensis]MBF0339260.1 histidinol phosphate phosphatase domain-containing protein [Nitrospirota bacterium]
MIDLHTHTILSDGQLIPSELVQRAAVIGYRCIALTDHGDASNLEFIIPRTVKVARELNNHTTVTVIPGVEITHVPPELIGEIVAEARAMGARLVVVHGETIVEPVKVGTNRAAIEAGVDILAHPGLITDEDVIRARDMGVTLEITARSGHSLSNGHVAAVAGRLGASLVINTDTHSPGDLINGQRAYTIGLAAGMSPDSVQQCFKRSEYIVSKALR